VVKGLTILLKKLTKKKVLLARKPLQAKNPDAVFVDGAGVAEAEADAGTAMSPSKLAQLDLHVVISLAILLTRKTRKMLLTRKPM